MSRKAIALAAIAICLLCAGLLYRGHKETRPAKEAADTLPVPEAPSQDNWPAAPAQVAPVQPAYEVQVEAALQPVQPPKVLPEDIENARKAVLAAPNDPVRLRRLAELEAKAGHERQAKAALARAKRAEREFKPKEAVSRTMAVGGAGPAQRPKAVRRPPQEKRGVTRVRVSDQGQSGR